VWTRTVRASVRIRYEPRLKRTLCSWVRCDSYWRQLSPGMVGKKLQRSNSSIPSDSAMISTSPTRITFLGIVSAPPCAGGPARGRYPSTRSRGEGGPAAPAAAPSGGGRRAAGCFDLRGHVLEGRGVESGGPAARIGFHEQTRRQPEINRTGRRVGSEAALGNARLADRLDLRGRKRRPGERRVLLTRAEEA